MYYLVLVLVVYVTYYPIVALVLVMLLVSWVLSFYAIT